MLFTQNQVRQFYVADSTFEVKTVTKSTGEGVRYFYFEYTNDEGKTVRTDLIDPRCAAIRMHAASTMQHTMKDVKIKLNSDYENAIASGQDYMLNIKINKFIADSEYTNTWRYGIVHATAAMVTDKSKFWYALAKSLYQNCSRDILPMIIIGLTNSTTATEFSQASPSGTFDGIRITESTQYWRLGQYPLRPVDFEVSQGEITLSGNTVTDWCTMTPAQGSTIPNSKEIADMEWFYHAFRGDTYHEYSYPNNFPFTAHVNPNDANGYDVLEIHYSWEGANHAVQKSEKDITIVATHTSGIIEHLYEAIFGNGDDVDGIITKDSGTDSDNKELKPVEDGAGKSKI